MTPTTPDAVKPRPIPQAQWTSTDGLPARAAQVVEYARWTAEDKCGAGYLRASIERDETTGEWIATVSTMLPQCRLSLPLWRNTAEEAMEAADQAAAQILEAMLGLSMSALCIEVEEGAEEPEADELWPELDEVLAKVREQIMANRVGRASPFDLELLDFHRDHYAACLADGKPDTAQLPLRHIATVALVMYLDQEVASA